MELGSSAAPFAIGNHNRGHFFGSSTGVIHKPIRFHGHHAIIGCSKRVLPLEVHAGRSEKGNHIRNGNGGVDRHMGNQDKFGQATVYPLFGPSVGQLDVEAPPALQMQTSLQFLSPNSSGIFPNEISDESRGWACGATVTTPSISFLPIPASFTAAMQLSYIISQRDLSGYLPVGTSPIPTIAIFPLTHTYLL